jgi:hypothetical protein
MGHALQTMTLHYQAGDIDSFLKADADRTNSFMAQQ